MLRDLKNVQDPRIVSLAEDLEGQVMEAIADKNAYGKWGKHYLPSLMSAHLLQQCNNFKDPGVQHYGGKLFRALRDEIDEIFCKLPPPTPSKKQYQYGGGGYSAPSAPVNMSMYNCAANGCFHESAQVLMADGSLKAISQLRKDDLVSSAPGISSRVLCLIKIRCPASQVQLVELPGTQLLITAYHPVRISGKWHFPCDLAPARQVACSSIYNVVLSSGHVMQVGGVQCVTLGHSFADDPVVAHPYFGSDAVVQDLKRVPGWASGLVEFSTNDCVRRDAKSGLVVGFVSDSAQNVSA